MARRSRTVPTTSNATPGRSRRPLGSVRRAQQITTYGVGSMIALGDQSYLVSGLDSWDVSEEDVLHEPRLEQRLGKSGFRRPPAGLNGSSGVKVRRFPQTYSCPECHALRPFRDFGGKNRRDNTCGRCGCPLTPSRFVVACEKGHLDEFPYWRWLHARREEGRRSTCSPGTAELKMHSTGRTASLRGIVVECSCGESASMEGAFSPHSMAGLGIGCRGRRPWLGPQAGEGSCDSTLRVLQRGSSAAWFPETESALSIPPWHDRLMLQVQRHKRHLLNKVDLSPKSEERILEFADEEGWLAPGNYTGEEVVRAVHALSGALREEEPEEEEDFFVLEAAKPIRQEEYRQLCTVTEDDPRNEHFVCVESPGVREAQLPGVERVMLVKRLREVRALRSFTRVEPLMHGPTDRLRAAPLAESSEIDWLPAIDVIGEGVFLSLDSGRLRGWESADGPGTPSARVAHLRANHERLLRAHLDESGPEEIRSPVTPRFVLLHTLAHALINEWSLDCGYPASSLRERLYVDDDMAGILLYTATSDSAGSLGGVIAQGEPDRLARSLESALARLSWCSADPLCMETETAGVNSLNLAACHSCVLLPETSCETNNVFLDRALLVGTPDGDTPGFFS
ncbi:DrmB family protein [Streptomyces sp. enrichment culture]|uniref:DrmB family protein n=1 Tax=Streptomyces sp. enrichment culture TaxID=1795815 RepID=UPI003F54D9EC